MPAEDDVRLSQKDRARFWESVLKMTLVFWDVERVPFSFGNIWQPRHGLRTSCSFQLCLRVGVMARNGARHFGESLLSYA